MHVASKRLGRQRRAPWHALTASLVAGLRQPPRPQRPIIRQRVAKASPGWLLLSQAPPAPAAASVPEGSPRPQHALAAKRGSVSKVEMD
jgi:hypothetical protein